MLKLLDKIFEAMGLGPEPKPESWEKRRARMRAPYLEDFERRFGKEFVATIRSVCTYPMTVDGKTKFCGKTGTHDGIIGMLCDEHHEVVHRLQGRKILI